MVPNAEGNLVKLLICNLTGEERRCIIGNYYNNLEDFISKLKQFLLHQKLYRVSKETRDGWIFPQVKYFSKT